MGSLPSPALNGQIHMEVNNHIYIEVNSGSYKLLEKIIINGFDVSFVCVF